MRRTSFAAASLWRFISLALIPLIVVGVFAGTRGSQSQRELVGWRNSVTASTVSADVESFMAAPAAALLEFAHVSQNPEARTTLGTSILDHFPSVESIVLIDANGRSSYAVVAKDVVADSRQYIGLDYSSTPLYLEALSRDEPVWSGVSTSELGGQRVLRLAARSSDGVAVGTLRIDSLESAVRKGQTHPGAEVVIADRSGTVLFHTSPEVSTLRPNWRNVEPIAQGIAGGFGQFEYTVAGERLFGSTHVVDGTDWTVLVQQGAADAMRPAQTVWTGIATVVVLVALISILASMRFARELSMPIARLSSRTAAVERGDYAGEPVQYIFRETADLGESIDRMASAVEMRESALRTTRDELFLSYGELTRAIAEKDATMARLSTLSAQLTVTEERQRRHLAEELHDRVSQALAVARIRLNLVGSGSTGDLEKLAPIDELLGQAITQTRAITSELSPPILYELGLGPAVQSLIDEASRTCGLLIHGDVMEDDTPLADYTEMALYRATRELIANVVKHAGALEVWITLQHEDDRVVLVVRDEGIGFDVETVTAADHFGLYSIRERFSQLGGELRVESAPGEGTLITAELPIA